MTTVEQTLEARIRRLEDIEEIRALCIAYGFYGDQRDFPAYAKLFSEAGIWSGPSGDFRGPSEILAMLEAATWPDGASCHLIANPIIDVSGDTATARVTWTYLSASAEGRPQVGGVGHYTHAFVREPAGWRFARREGTREIPPATA